MSCSQLLVGARLLGWCVAIARGSKRGARTNRVEPSLDLPMRNMGCTLWQPCPYYESLLDIQAAVE